VIACNHERGTRQCPAGGDDMGKVISGITTSLDGYVTGPNDGPERGLGEGGERLHYWVFGGPWSYAEEPRGEATGADKEYLDSIIAKMGAVIGGRWTYEAAEHWGGQNPWSVPFFIVTHRPDDQPKDGGFTFVDSLDTAIEAARAAAGDKDVHVMGGADTIRQAIHGPFARVLGRKTYDIYAAYWPTAPEEAGGKPLNDTTKYVASRGRPQREWSKSVLLEGDAAEAVAALKQTNGPELQVHGSGN